jgi:transcriptional regulator with XRE-family HTH domain
VRDPVREPVSEFGREVRNLRRGRAMSQARLAELAGLTASYLSQLETGERNPTPGVSRRLSPHLGVSPGHLLGKIGTVEMNLAGSLTGNREYVARVAPGLTGEQAEEMASYLTYLEFKEQVLGGAADRS